MFPDPSERQILAHMQLLGSSFLRQDNKPDSSLINAMSNDKENTLVNFTKIKSFSRIVLIKKRFCMDSVSNP